MITPPKRRSGFSLESATFYVSLLILAATAGAFFYIRYSVGQNNNEFILITDQANKQKTDDQKNLEARIFLAKQKLGDFSKKMANRRSSSEFFNNFEGLVLPEVYFSECDADFVKAVAKLTGHAKNFQALGQQLVVFRSAANIVESVDLKKIQLDEKGQLDFEADIGIGPEMAAFK